MPGRQNNKLPNNLPQLQNLIKRDPQSYLDEVGAVSKHAMLLASSAGGQFLSFFLRFVSTVF